MRKPWSLFAVAVFVATWVAGSFAGHRASALSEDTRSNLQTFTELVEAARDNYAVEVKYQDLVFASLGGMLRTLDPHTSFLPPQAFRTMRDKQAASFYGLGILVGQRNGRLTVITPIEGTPAARLGVRTGDVIHTIEGEPTEDMTTDEAIDKLKGPKGTQVNITIRRRGVADPLPLQVTRAEIPQTTVRHAYLLTPDTGYLWITDFARGTGREVGAALTALRAQGMKRLILDLRNNGGGLLDQAIDVADYFLPEAAAIVETRGRTRESFSQYKDIGEHPPLDLPLVVLVNRGTASASEIVSGAIQDHDLGLIVGTPTWGKGLVQTVYNLPYGAGMALTTARYYTPSGRLIQRDYSDYFDYYTNLPDASTGAVPKPDEPVFLTDLKRKVFGGGGITPDVIAELEDAPTFIERLVFANAPFDFAVDYTREHPVKSRVWAPDEAVMKELESWLVREKVVTPEEIATELGRPEVRDDLRRRVHAEVFNATFGVDAAHAVRAGADVQIQKALALLDRAGEMLAERKRLEKSEPAAPAASARLDS